MSYIDPILEPRGAYAKFTGYVISGVGVKMYWGVFNELSIDYNPAYKYNIIAIWRVKLS